MLGRKRNGRSENLKSAIALLIQTQAHFGKTEAANAEEDRQRFDRIECPFEAIKAILTKHEEILQKLPEAIRDKVGFKQ